MLARNLVLLSSVGLTSLGCAALIGLAQHKASGPNPLSGQPLVNEWRVGLTPYVDCDPVLPPHSASLSATEQEVCVTTVDFVDTPAKHADVTESERPSGEESLGARRLLVDGKTSDAFEMRAEGGPALVSRCQPAKPGAAGSPAYYRLWRVTAKGCTPNKGLLTASSKEVGLQREGAMAPYAVWSFDTAGRQSASRGSEPITPNP